MSGLVEKAAAVQDTEKQPELLSRAAADTDSATAAATAAAREEPVRQAWYQWFSPTDTSEERRLIAKLDLLILVFVFLAYWAKVLDQSATSAAYVSGMREDLHLFGNELNYLNAAYLVGIVVPQVPLTLLMTRAPSVGWVLPAADVAWAALTLAQFRVASVGPLYALRFLVGAAGSLFFPAVQWYLGCWYTRAELGRRGALFFVASQVGGMSAGYVQAGAHATLHMRGGLEGWRWLYIICFTATMPVAALGFLCLPGLPERPRSLFLSPREAELARTRMRAERRQPRRPMTQAVFKKTLTGWRFWALVGFAFFFSQADGVSANSGLPLWLKARNYSVEEINTINTVSPAVTIVSAIFGGVLSDAYDAKVPLIAATALLNILASAVLAVWHVPTGLKFFAFFLAGSANGIAPVVYAWANEICAGDAEERAIVLSSMNTLGNAFGAWLPLFVWKTTDAPRYLIGYTWTIALDVGMLVMLFVLRSFWNREKARQAEK